MACTKEEIENKRLAALQRIHAKRISLGNEGQGFSNSPGPIQKNTPKPKYQPYEKRNPTQTTLSTPSKIISGTMYLISEDRFEVKPSEFNDILISVFKTIPSKIYDCEKRLWNFSLQHYEELQNKVSLLRPNIVLGTIPNYVLNVMRSRIPEFDPDMSQIDQMLQSKLLPFQKDGVRFGILKNGRCMIADDMGLGKTFQALAIAHYYIQDWPLLIVTTSTMRETWESKINELLPSIPLPSIICVSSGKEKNFLLDKQAKIVIISYKMTTLCTSILIEKKFGVVILDESHLLKSYKAQSTEAIMKIAKYSKRIILLSGTPALSRPNELFTQLQFIEPKFFHNFIEFGKRYCDGKQTNFGWDMSGQSNLIELQILLHKKFLIRRTKEQVLTRLRDKTRETVILDPTLLDLNPNSKENLLTLAQSYDKKKAADKHSALLSFFSETSKVKIPAICKYVNNIIKDGDKFLIFAHHRNVLDAICQTLDECRVHYISIDGTTKTSHRSILVDKFQLNDSCRCAVLSITAANSGITLTAAQLVIFAELHWNPGILSQAESRAHRIGQQGGVLVKYLLAKGTSDDYMWPMLERKLTVLNQVGLSKDTFNDASLKMQSPSKSIGNYFSASNSKFIPGTNIPEDRIAQKAPDIEDTFLEDNEGDELLAAVDI